MQKSLLSALITVLFFVQASAQTWDQTGNALTSASKFGSTNAQSVNFITNNLQRMKLDSIGRLGLGTAPVNLFTLKGPGSTPASSWVTSGTPLVMAFGETTPGNADFVLNMASANSAARGVMVFKRARGTLAAPAALVNNDYLGSLLAGGYDGSNFQGPAAVDFFVDGTPSAGNLPARISFVTGTNAANRTERLKIASGGDLIVTSGNLVFGSAAKTLMFATPTVTSAPMITMFPSGNENPTRMVIAQSPANSSWGLAYNDTVDQFDFVAAGVSGFNIDAAEGNVTARNTVNAATLNAAATTTTAVNASTTSTSPAAYVYNFGSGHGVYGYTAGGSAANPYGISGVYGYNNAGGYGTGGYGTNGPGVFGYSVNNAGVMGSGTWYAGYFNGNVYSTGTITSSDRKLKKDISDLTKGMDIISRLKPKTYQFRQDGNYKLMNLPEGRQYGLIAQDVEEVLPTLVKQTEFDPNMITNLSTAKSPNTTVQQKAEEKIEFKGVNYTELIPIMVKGMQEQQETIEALTKKMDEQNKKIEAMTSLVEKLTSGSTSNTTSSMLNLTSASLGQNIPNPPVNGITTIDYFIPENAVRAEIRVVNSLGQQIHQQSTTGKGKGTVSVNTSGLNAGAYYYTLYVDGALIETKKLVIASK